MKSFFRLPQLGLLILGVTLALVINACKPKPSDPSPTKTWDQYRVKVLVMRSIDSNIDETVDSLQLVYNSQGKPTQILRFSYSRNLSSAKPGALFTYRYDFVYLPNGEIDYLKAFDYHDDKDHYEWVWDFVFNRNPQGMITAIDQRYAWRTAKNIMSVNWNGDGTVEGITRTIGTSFRARYDQKGNITWMSVVNPPPAATTYEATFAYDEQPNPFWLLSRSGVNLFSFFLIDSRQMYDGQFLLSKNNPVTMTLSRTGFKYNFRYKRNNVGLPEHIEILPETWKPNSSGWYYTYNFYYE